MEYVTQTQFNDVASRIFLRFDETDKKMDRQCNQLRVQIDHLGTRLDEFIVEQREINARLGDRITSLGERRKSIQH